MQLTSKVMANLPRQMSTLNVDTLHFTARAAGRGQYIKQQLLAKGQSYFCQCKSNNSVLNGVSCMFIMPCLTSQIISYDICLFCALWTLLSLFLSLSDCLSLPRLRVKLLSSIIMCYYYYYCFFRHWFDAPVLSRNCSSNSRTCKTFSLHAIHNWSAAATATATRRMSNVPKVDLWNHSNISN